MSIDRQALHDEWVRLRRKADAIGSKLSEVHLRYSLGRITAEDWSRKVRNLTAAVAPIHRRMRQIQRSHRGPFRCP